MRFCSSLSDSSDSLPACFSARMARSFSFSCFFSARVFAASSSARRGAPADLLRFLLGQTLVRAATMVVVDAVRVRIVHE